MALLIEVKSNDPFYDLSSFLENNFFDFIDFIR